MTKVNEQIEMVKALRNETGAGLVEAKKTLQSVDFNYEEARAILAAKGIEKVQAREEKEVHEGIVFQYTHPSKRLGSFVVLNCETDFVANTDVFQELAKEIAIHVAATDPQDSRELMEAQYIKDETVTIATMVQQASAKLGEKIVVARFARFAV